LSPYILLATALILMGIVAWLWESGATQGDPARFFIALLSMGAVTAGITAAGLWIEDTTVSLSFAAAARMYSTVLTFLLFLFARSFSKPADFTLLYWSVPLQFGMAVVILNWQHMFRLSGSTWILNMDRPFAWMTVAVNWTYGILAMVYAVGLYMTLKREGKKVEKERTLIMITALIILFVATAIQGLLSGAVGYAINIAYLGHLLGALLLVWAFRGPVILKPLKR